MGRQTPIGKVDEVLGPINQVYFTIKTQEGIVPTSFKSGDKFYIGGDKLLPLENVPVELPGVVQYEEDVAEVDGVSLVTEVEGVGFARKNQAEVDSLQDVGVVEEAPEAILPFQGLEALTVGGGHRV
ncbi:MAG: hypothetical protein Q9167_000085 [Letrouitia subvulpina]